MTRLLHNIIIRFRWHLKNLYDSGEQVLSSKWGLDLDTSVWRFTLLVPRSNMIQWGYLWLLVWLLARDFLAEYPKAIGTIRHTCRKTTRFLILMFHNLITFDCNISISWKDNILYLGIKLRASPKKLVQTRVTWGLNRPQTHSIFHFIYIR